eukprot:12087805-Heterocapsa_arctica.AAC.1
MNFPTTLTTLTKTPQEEDCRTFRHARPTLLPSTWELAPGIDQDTTRLSLTFIPSNPCTRMTFPPSTNK